MTERGYEIRPLLIRDHHALVELGILKHPYRAAREQVAAWLQMMPASLCYAVEADGAFMGAVCCFMERGAPFSGRIQFYLNAKATNDLTSWIQMLLDELFQTANIHRLELLLPANLHDLGDRLLDYGFTRDGLLRDVLPFGKAWQDAELYAILREEQGMHQYAFIPFDPSVIMIYGDDQKIDSIDFIQYGDKIEMSRMFDTAYARGIINENGIVVRSSEAIRELEEPANLTGKSRELPVAVAQAVSEIREYLSGKREQFDFTVNEETGTDFQRSIWSILREIPYGQTRSYMEIALSHIEKKGDGLSEKERRKQAQNLSRAVGMACGANPLCLFTPCHRVLGQDRKLTGFSGGIQTKAALLDLELLNSSSDYIVPFSERYKKKRGEKNGGNHEI